MFLDIFFVVKKYTLEFCSIFFYILSSKNTRKLIFAVFFTFYPLKITRKIFVVSFMFLIIISLPNMISQDVGCEAAIHTFKTIFESNKKGRVLSRQYTDASNAFNTDRKRKPQGIGMTFLAETNSTLYKKNVGLYRKVRSRLQILLVRWNELDHCERKASQWSKEKFRWDQHQDN